MDRVGVRELKQNASAVLSEVERGKTFVVTVQGRDIGQLGPLPSQRWVPGELAMTLYDVPAAADLWDDIEAARQSSDQDDPWER